MDCFETLILYFDWYLVPSLDLCLCFPSSLLSYCLVCSNYNIFKKLQDFDWFVYY